MGGYFLDKTLGSSVALEDGRRRGPGGISGAGLYMLQKWCRLPCHQPPPGANAPPLLNQGGEPLCESGGELWRA